MNTEQRIFLSLALVFFLLMHWVGYNEASRFALTRAIVEEGRFDITSFAQSTGDRVQIGSRYFSDKPPGVSLLGVPLHALSALFLPVDPPPESRTVLIDEENDVMLPTHPSPAVRLSMILMTFLLSGLATVGTAFLLFLFAKEIISDTRVRYLVPIGYALGTLAFPNALVLQGHATAAFFAFAAFMASYWTAAGRLLPVRGGIVAGMLAGIAFLTDYLALFAVAGIALWYLFTRHARALLWFGGAFAVFAMLLASYNAALFENPLSFGYSHLDWRGQEIAFRVDPGYIGERLGNGMTVHDLEESMSTAQFAILGFVHPAFFGDHLATIARLLAGPERGIFLYFPFLLLAIPGMVILYRQRPRLAAAIGAVVLGMLWFVSLPYFPWWGDASFGPRHLTLAVPFLMIPVMFGMRRVSFSASLLLVLASIAVNIIGLQPPADIGKKLVLMSEEYLAAMRSPAPIENTLAERYWPKLRKEGINMPLVSNALTGRPFDIRNFAIRSPESIMAFSTPAGFLMVSTTALPFLVMALIFILVWFPVLGRTLWAYPAVALLAFLAVWSVHTASIAYDSSWYGRAEDEEYNGMAERGSIMMFFPEERRATLVLDVIPYERERDLAVLVNGKAVFEDPLLVREQTALIIPDVFIRQGTNTITLESRAPCRTPYEAEREADFRCLTFQVADPLVL